ncbi:unnamed protein product [Amaranthus hypochondriacus]
MVVEKPQSVGIAVCWRPQLLAGCWGHAEEAAAALALVVPPDTGGEGRGAAGGCWLLNGEGAWNGPCDREGRDMGFVS